jgi:hypothetical protein
MELISGFFIIFSNSKIISRKKVFGNCVSKQKCMVEYYVERKFEQLCASVDLEAGVMVFFIITRTFSDTKNLKIKKLKLRSNLLQIKDSKYRQKFYSTYFSYFAMKNAYA